SEPAALALKALVNYRDFHGRTRAGGWRMDVSTSEHGVRVVAFAGARPFVVLAPGAAVTPAHEWYLGYGLAREAERGLDAADDNLHVATFRATLHPGDALTVVCSAEPAPVPDGEAAWRRRQAHEAELLSRWRRVRPAAAPAWVDRLALAADQFVVRRPIAADAEAMSVIAGYPWFGDWGRDTMISLPGLRLATRRAEGAARLLATVPRLVRPGAPPNAF